VAPEKEPAECFLDEEDEGYVYCLLYTSDAADDLTRVDLGGRRIIKKKKVGEIPTRLEQEKSTEGNGMTT